MSMKAQSALEFLTTYSFSFLLIAIVLTILLLFSSLPKEILPTQCTFYSGLNCGDVSYFNISSGTELVLLVTDTSPGQLRMTNFTATIPGAKDNLSSPGYCTPGVVFS